MLVGVSLDEAAEVGADPLQGEEGAMRSWLAGWLFLCSSLAWGAETPKLLDVTVHLLFEHSGRVSDDVSSIADFGSFNFMSFGTGVPQDQFRSFLIRLAFEVPSERYEEGTVATVRLINEGKDAVFQQTLPGVHFAKPPKNYVWIFVEGHVCEPVTLEVTSFGRVVKKDLAFSCGE